MFHLTRTLIFTGKRLAKVLVSIAVYLFDLSIDRVLQLTRNYTYGHRVVLYYHAITPRDRRRFREQIEWLVNHVKLFSLEEDPKMGGFRRSVALTFDDGFECILENAVPELLSRGVAFAIFVPAGVLGMQADWVEREGGEDGCMKVMSAKQLRRLARNKLVSIGSHGLTHRNLLTLKEKISKEEIIRSKGVLENLVQREVHFLSFPYGAFEISHVRWARLAGYKMVFSTIPKEAFLDEHEYIVGRIRVDPSDWPIEFRLKALGCYRWLPYAFKLKKQILSRIRIGGIALRNK